MNEASSRLFTTRLSRKQRGGLSRASHLMCFFWDVSVSFIQSLLTFHLSIDRLIVALPNVRARLWLVLTHISRRRNVFFFFLLFLSSFSPVSRQIYPISPTLRRARRNIVYVRLSSFTRFNYYYFCGFSRLSSCSEPNMQSSVGPLLAKKRKTFGGIHFCGQKIKKQKTRVRVPPKPFLISSICRFIRF